MTTPSTMNADVESAIELAIEELMGVSSLLHEPPDPIKPGDKNYRGPEASYICDTDHGMMHAAEHLRAAIKAIVREKRFIWDINRHLSGGKTIDLETFEQLRRNCYATP